VSGKRLAIVITACVVFSFGSILRAADVPVATSGPEDWPKWLGPRGDNISKESLGTDWGSDGPKQLWSAKVGEGHSSPVAVAGKIYLFTLDDNRAETLTCFDAKTGNVQWKESYPVREKPQYAGTRGTPTVEGDRIYTMGEAGDLTCRELADGKPVWQTNVHQAAGGKLLMWGCASSPTIVGDRIFVQTGCEKGPTAVAVNKATGKIEWKSESTAKGGYATLVHADVKGKPQLFLFAGQNAGAIDPANGKTIWGDKFETQYDVNAATPLYRDGRVLFTAEYKNGRATMYEVTNKSWKKLWETRAIRSRFQPAILDGDVVYGNASGDVAAMDWNTGKELWHTTGRNEKIGVGGSLLRVAGDKLVTMSERGKLSLLRADPKGYRVLASTQLFDGEQIWASPLAYDGKLYCKGRDEFVCLDVAAK
jgi:outer membrane protein assembly factor BamB